MRAAHAGRRFSTCRDAAAPSAAMLEVHCSGLLQLDSLKTRGVIAYTAVQD